MSGIFAAAAMLPMSAIILTTVVTPSHAVVIAGDAAWLMVVTLMGMAGCCGIGIMALVRSGATVGTKLVGSLVLGMVIAALLFAAMATTTLT